MIKSTSLTFIINIYSLLNFIGPGIIIKNNKKNIIIKSNYFNINKLVLIILTLNHRLYPKKNIL